MFPATHHEVTWLLPDLRLHGLSQGDLEPALGGCWPRGAPVALVAWLRATWEEQFGLGSSRVLRIWKGTRASSPRVLRPPLPVPRLTSGGGNRSGTTDPDHPGGGIYVSPDCANLAVP